jgi:WD40 repeat protein
VVLDGDLYLTNPINMNLTRRYVGRWKEGHSNSVNSVAITSDNTKIVSRSQDNTIKVWDLNGSKGYLSCKFDSSIIPANFSKSENLIAIGDDLGDLYAGSLFV